MEQRQTGRTTETMPDISQKNNLYRYRMLLCVGVLIYLSALLARTTKIVLDPTLPRDGAFYLLFVEHWIATGDYVYTFFDRIGIQPPLSLWMIKTLTLAGFNPEIAGRSISMFFGSMIPVVGFFFTLRISRSIRMALVAALLLVFQPDLVMYSGQPLRENTYVFFSGMLLLLLADAMTRSSIPKWAACGVFLALSAFCRFEALEFCVIVPFLLAALCYFGKLKIKEAVLNVAAFFLFLAMTSVILWACADFDLRLIARPLEFIGNVF
jgi:4-amino-4-deoxy-L-arabinose transferase-like glycosyltransferase